MVYALSTEPGEEGRKNMFPEEMDITPSVEDLPADKPEKEEEKEEDISSVEGEPVNLGDLEEIAKAAGYNSWKAIIIEGCKVKTDKGKAVFSADIDEDGAKDLLQNDKNRFSGNRLRLARVNMLWPLRMGQLVRMTSHWLPRKGFI